MKNQKTTLPAFDSQRKLEQDLIAFLNFVGSNTLQNAENKIAGERRKYDEAKLQTEEVKKEVCQLVGSKDFTGAKKRIAAVFAKLGKSPLVSDQYQLDTSFLEGIGKQWDRKADGKNEVSMIQNLNKKIAHQRSIVEDVYNKFLDRVVVICHEEQVSEEVTRLEVERWHSAMAEDFDLLTVAEFWEKYCGDLHDMSVKPKEPHTILLHDALPLIKKYAPIRVYQELYDDDPERLGHIPRYKFDKWNDRVIGLKQLSGDALTKEKYTITAEILSETTFRRIEGPEAILNPGKKETSLMFILAHEEINPYGREFNVDDNTSFLEIHQLYSQYSEANK